MKKFIQFLGVFILLGLIFLLTAPYKYHDDIAKQAIKYSIEIEADKAFIFNYLGNSNNARDWSVFVDHISTLNGTMVPDGDINSIRRCFKNENEEGIRWDEEILEVIPNKKRKLSCFNLKGFFMKTDNIRTEQVYKTLSPNKTYLTFSVYFEGTKSISNTFKIRIASWNIKYIFRKNMENIKMICEKDFK